MEAKVDMSRIFGTNVFSDAVMRGRLPKNIYKSLRETIDYGIPLDPHVADVVATVMRDWAMEHGATHYCHWFQPMTGLTAQKHEAFISSATDGAIAQFSGKELIKGESDASSFPSGGIRSTFEARGYTAWDCTSPAFIKDGVLCIPTAFCSYYGDALDKKTPLLRSMEVLSAQAVRVLELLGEKDCQQVIPTVGAEQEYFLVDKDHYDQRKDLIFTGRTLFGAAPPKGQEMEDHYYASIKERIQTFMNEVNRELWKLGVAVKTEHNEVALGQFELAPLFTSSNVASDQNQLIMDVLKKVAGHHNLVCLLHEKPFAHMNGSGKHVNWSLSVNGENILDPGDNPHENTRFLLFLCTVIKAVDQYPELLRMSSSNPGNDFRLGAAEAPPAIISMYLGKHLTDLLEQIEQDQFVPINNNNKIAIGVKTIPAFPHDATDRNRTSSFAFTANKFEFRMVASSISIAGPCTVLNTAVADSLDYIAGRLEQAEDVQQEVIAVIKDIVRAHKRVIFNGDGYSEAWRAEAQKRGLPSITSYVESIPHLVSKKAISLFERTKVLSDAELHARYEIHIENYIKQMRIEALAMVDLTKRTIIPAVMNYINELATGVQNLHSIGLGDLSGLQKELIADISDKLTQASTACTDLAASLDKYSTSDMCYEHGYFLRYTVVPKMNELRSIVDSLERLVAKDAWPWPGYDDILFAL